MLPADVSVTIIWPSMANIPHGAGTATPTNGVWLFATFAASLNGGVNGHRALAASATSSGSVACAEFQNYQIQQNVKLLCAE